MHTEYCSLSDAEVSDAAWRTINDVLLNLYDMTCSPMLSIFEDLKMILASLGLLSLQLVKCDVFSPGFHFIFLHQVRYAWSLTALFTFSLYVSLDMLAIAVVFGRIFQTITSVLSVIISNSYN